MDNFDEYKKAILKMMNDDFLGFFKALLSIETGVDIYVPLEEKYVEFMSDLNMSLLNPKLTDIKVPKNEL